MNRYFLDLVKAFDTVYVPIFLHSWKAWPHGTLYWISLPNDMNLLGWCQLSTHDYTVPQISILGMSLFMGNINELGIIRIVPKMIGSSPLLTTRMLFLRVWPGFRLKRMPKMVCVTFIILWFRNNFLSVINLNLN